jgi:hypothetical protein
MENIIIIEDDEPQNNILIDNHLDVYSNNESDNESDNEYNNESDYESNNNSDNDSDNDSDNISKNSIEDYDIVDGYRNVHRLTRKDITNIKKHLVKNNFVNGLKNSDIKCFEIISELKNKYDFNPIDILFKIKFEQIELIPNRYFDYSHLKKIIKYSKYFSESRLLEIINYICVKTSTDNIMTKFITCLNNKYFLKIKTYKQILCVDFILNYFDPKPDILDEPIRKKYQLVNFFSNNLDIKLKNLNLKIELTKEKKTLDKKFLHIYLNTSDSNTINYIIKNMKKFKFSYWDFIYGLDKILNEERITIKEEDIIKIISMNKNSSMEISKAVLDIIYFERLIKHNLVTTIDLFKYVDISKLYQDYTSCKNVINNILLEANFKRIKYLLTSDVLSKIMKNNNIWDIILCDENITDIIIKLGIELPYDYINKTFSENYVCESLILSRGDKYFTTWSKMRRIRNFKNKMKKSTLTSIDENKKIFYKNFCKFGIPLNDKIISNFINYINPDDIIKFYSKTSDINYIIPYVIYTNKYDLLEKIFEKKLLDLKEYKTNFSSYLTKAFGKNNYRYPLNTIYKVYKLNKKYDIKPSISFIKNVLKLGNLNIIKHIISQNKKFSINYKTIANILSKNNYFWVNGKRGKIFDYIKPYIRQIKKLYTDINFVQRLLTSYENLTLGKILEYKKLCPELKIYLIEINKYDFKFNNDDDTLKLIEYIFEENYDPIKKKLEDEKIFIVDSKSLLNFVNKFISEEKIVNRTVELYKKYINDTESIKQKEIYLELFNNIYKSSTTIKIYEKFGLYKHNLYSNTVIICMIIYQDYCNDIIQYCLYKYPYIQERTYNYLISLREYHINTKKSHNKKNNYLITSIEKKINNLNKIIKMIPKKNIIPNDIINDYIDKTKERPNNFELVTGILNVNLFEDFIKTDKNDIVADL